MTSEDTPSLRRLSRDVADVIDSTADLPIRPQVTPGLSVNGEELVEVIVPEIGDPVAQLAVVDRFVRELRLPPAEFFPSATPGHYTYCAQGRARSAWIHGQEWSITTTVPSRRGGSE